jgi:adenosylcobinamide-phosphate guanylyltransferase
MHALVMAGGKGTRMNARCEKPLLNINGKPMISYVLNALIDSKCFNYVWVAVSKNTVNTKAYLNEHYRSVMVIDTPAIDYVYDLNYALTYISNHMYNAEPILITAADLPLLDCNIVKYIIDMYEHYSSKKDAWIVIVVSTKLLRDTQVSSKLQVNGIDKYYSGISIVNPRVLDNIIYNTHNSIKEEYMLIDDVRVAVNVNTMNDLKLAEMMLLSLT